MTSNNTNIDLNPVLDYESSLQYADYKFKNNEQFVLLFVTQNGKALQWASSQLKNNKRVVLAAVERDPLSLEYASDELKNDKGIVIAAAKKNASALEFASKELLEDHEVLHCAMNSRSTLKFKSQSFCKEMSLRLAILAYKNALFSSYNTLGGTKALVLSNLHSVIEAASKLEHEILSAPLDDVEETFDVTRACDSNVYDLSQLTSKFLRSGKLPRRTIDELSNILNLRSKR